MTKKYLSNLFSTYQKGDTREKTYYERLADFVRDNSQQKESRGNFSSEKLKPEILWHL